MLNWSVMPLAAKIEAAKRDDICARLVPSDIRMMLKEIQQLRAAIEAHGGETPSAPEVIDEVGGPLGWTVYKVGDLVTRDGTDIHRVTAVNDGGQMIVVECVKPAASGSCEIGETESNLALRYEYAGDVIEGEATEQSPQAARLENGA